MSDDKALVPIDQQRVSPGRPVTDEQAAEIAQQVKALAGLLTQHDPGKNLIARFFSRCCRARRP